MTLTATQTTAAAPSNEDAAAPARLVMVTQYAEQVPTLEATREFVAAVKARGVTAVGLAVPWKFIETAPGQFDYSWADARLDLFVEAGLRFHVRVECSRVYQPEWLGDRWMRKADGTVFVRRNPHLGDYRIVSYADDFVRERVATFTAALAKHVWDRYEKRPGPHPLDHIYPMFTTCAETEYPHEAMTDYGPAAQAAFGAWLKERHGTPERLAERWGRPVAGLADARLQDAPPYDFHAFRTEILGRFIDAYAQAVHEACPAPVTAQWGSVWDGLSLIRGTLDVARIGRSLDLLIVDDAPEYDQLFSMDYLRGFAGGRRFVNETGGPWNPESADALVPRFGRDIFSRGAAVYYITNMSARMIGDPVWTFWEPTVALGREPVTPVTARKAIVVSLATLYAMRHHQSVQDLVYDLYLQLSEDRAVPVDFVNDTLIADHPERLAQYTAGLYVPDTMTRMTDGLLASLAAAPVPVTMDKSKAGTLDEYGRLRERGIASKE